MRKTYLFTVFIILSFFMISHIVYGGYLDDLDELSKLIWKLVKEGISAPEWITNLLTNLGWSEEQVQSLEGIVLFAIFPVIFFTIVVHDIFIGALADTGIRTFKGVWGWITAFFFVITLCVLKIVSAFTLWLYLNAAALTLYMTFFLVIMALVNQWCKKMTGLAAGVGRWGWVGRIILILCMGIMFLIPSMYGFVLSIFLYVIATIGGGILLRKVVKEREVKEMVEHATRQMEKGKEILEIINGALKKAKKEEEAAVFQSAVNTAYEQLETLPKKWVHPEVERKVKRWYLRLRNRPPEELKQQWEDIKPEFENLKKSFGVK